MPAPHRRVSVTVSGRVQGVGFRAAASERAGQLGLTGWVRNLPDGRVELLAEGPAASIAMFLLWCQSGPSWSRVEACQVVDAPPLGDLTGFRVRH